MQRALICASFSKDTSILFNIVYSDDTLHLIHALQKMGAELLLFPDRIEINGKNFLQKEPNILNAGESGFNARALSFVTSIAEKPGWCITGEKSLLHRSMRSLHENLINAGIQFKTTGNYLPLWITGQPTQFFIAFNEIDTSQTLSGMMLAFPSLNKNQIFSVRLKNLPSKPYVRLTKHVLELFDVHVNLDEENAILHIPCGQTYQSVSMSLEGDWSHAALWLAAASVQGNLTLSGLHLNSLQGDRIIIDLLQQIQIPLNTEGDTIYVTSTSFHAFEFDLTHNPDLAPAVVILALAAQGKSVIRGCNRLVNKESNRLDAILSVLRQIHARFDYKNDILIVHGKHFSFPEQVSVPPDHRMVMMAILLGVMADKPYVVPHLNAISKSYPNFITDFFHVCKVLEKTSQSTI